MKLVERSEFVPRLVFGAGDSRVAIRIINSGPARSTSPDAYSHTGAARMPPVKSSLAIGWRPAAKSRQSRRGIAFAQARAQLLQDLRAERLT
jgi:hypothetical protein